MAIKHILRNNVLTLRLLIGATTVSIIAILSIVSFLLVREHRTAELAAIRTTLQQQRALGTTAFQAMVQAKTHRFAGTRPAHRPPRQKGQAT